MVLPALSSHSAFGYCSYTPRAKIGRRAAPHKFGWEVIFMKETEKRNQDRGIGTGTPGWYFDWNTGQYWPDGTPQEEKDEFKISCNGVYETNGEETAEHAERFLKENTEATVLK